MYEGVSRGAGPILPGKATAGGESISKFHKRPRRFLSRVRDFNAMMQMNLNFAPPCVTVFRQTVNQGSIVFLGRIKICMP
jgi:hypothetical protein